MVETIKPFADIKKNYTNVHNFCFDVCMPCLSNAGWRILCVAIRKTLGWSDDSTPSGRKDWDRISYSQFREASGLRSDASVSKGIKETIEAGYIIRRKVGKHQGTGAPLYAYCLNQEYETDAPMATTESVVEHIDHKTSTSKTEAAATLETEAAATLETVETKGKEKAMGKENIDPFSSLWSPVLDDLQLQMTRQTFDTWLRGSHIVSAENGTWTVNVRHAYAVDWLNNRLMRKIMQAVKRHAPNVEQIKFIAQETSP